MTEEEIKEKVKKLKNRVSELVQEVNELKKQLEISAISLPEFQTKKDNLQNELREILNEIAEYKEQTGISESTKKDSQVAEQAKDLMYYFQTDFEESISKAKVYLSITVDMHFIFEIDYSKYPERPILQVPDEINEKFKPIETFYKKIPSYSNWNEKAPKNIYELATEIETVLINEYSADLQAIEQASIKYVEETQALIQRLIRKAGIELDVKNIDKVVEIYKSIIDLAYEIKDFQVVSEYSSKLDELLKIIRKTKK